MAKPTNKRAAAAAAAAGKPSWVRKHLGFVLVAIGVQLFLTIGYLSWPEAPAQEAASARGAAEPLGAGPPAVCPDDWDECPRVAGVDWPALFARERAPETQPTTEALAKCEAHGLLSPLTVPGMHLVCVLPPPPAAAATRPGAEASATLAIFDQMLSSSAPSRILLLPANLRTGEHAVAAVQRAIGFARPAQTKWGEYQPAALFTDRGVRVATVEGMLQSMRTAGAGGAGAVDRVAGASRLLCLEGGQWLWPPVEIGHAHLLPDLVAAGVTTRIVTKSFRPLVVEVENFLTPGENHHIISRAKPHMAKSGVALKDVDKGKAAKEFRTSSQYFLPTTSDPILERIDKRVSWLTRVPISHAEYIQVLQYKHLEHYSAHHDYFDPAAYASNPEMLQSVEHGAKNRLATVFFYLNSLVGEGDDLAQGGGQTNFPRAATPEMPNGGPQPMDYFDCSKGLSVYPQEGKVIIFYSMLADGRMDELSLHGGCDVLDQNQTKYSANFWLWNKPYHFVDRARKRATQEMMSEWI
mmetsp:Transcript_13811/g.45114  ORF Transcript_13811/g.45114 Transcript_13811/m.45114 type:complete len:524 (+) Transcript_13811:90-1661(+)